MVSAPVLCGNALRPPHQRFRHLRTIRNASSAKNAITSRGIGISRGRWTITGGGLTGDWSAFGTNVTSSVLGRTGASSMNTVRWLFPFVQTSFGMSPAAEYSVLALHG